MDWETATMLLPVCKSLLTLGSVSAFWCPKKFAKKSTLDWKCYTDHVLGKTEEILSRSLLYHFVLVFPEALSDLARVLTQEVWEDTVAKKNRDRKVSKQKMPIHRLNIKVRPCRNKLNLHASKTFKVFSILFSWKFAVLLLFLIKGYLWS